MPEPPELPEIDLAPLPCAHVSWSTVIDDAGRSVPECNDCGYAPEATRYEHQSTPRVAHGALIPCPVCKGEGSIPNAAHPVDPDCLTCEGTGLINPVERTPEAAAFLDYPSELNMLELSPGFYRGVPNEVYHARHVGLASKSALDHVNRSSMHYKWWVDGGEEEETPALAFGSAFHCALLEPDRWCTSYCVVPDFGDCRFKINKAARDEWRRDHAGWTEITFEDAKAIDGMVAAVRAHPLAGKMIRDGEAEITLRWNDEETGLPCKCRADYYVRRLSMAVDFKSAIDARKAAFRKAVSNYGYHRQDGFYRSGFAAIEAPIKHFVFVVVEKAAPHAVAIYTLGANALARGRASVREDLAALGASVKANEWSGYPTSIQELDDLPPWAA